MKRFIYAVLFCCVCTLSCNKEEGMLSKPDNPGPSTEIKVTDLDLDMGRMVYKFIKYHIGFTDPYSYVPAGQRAEFKKFIESQTNARTSAESAWEQLASTGKVSRISLTRIKSFNKDLDSYIQSGNFSSVSEIDGWFEKQRGEITSNASMQQTEKNEVLQTQSLIRYAIKAYAESVLPATPPKDNASRTNISGSCILSLFSCGVTNIVKYVGFGKLFASSSTQGTATTYGAILGAAISLFTCDCANGGSEPCTFAYAVSTPDVCYNSTAGLVLKAMGYGGSASGFEFEVYKADNTAPGNILVQRPVASQQTTITNAELQGYTTVYVRANANCGGTIKYSPSLIRIDLAELGRPDYSISGPTTVHTSSNPYGYYEIIGRNGQSATMTAGAYYGTTPTGVSHSPGSGILTCTWTGTGSGWIKATVYDCTGSPVYKQLSVNVSN